MATNEDAKPPTLDQLGRQQLEIYAKELNEQFHKERRLRQQLEIYAKELKGHFDEERCLRQELEGRNEQLEQRVREITALNQMFQEHLAQDAPLARANVELREGLQRLVLDARVLLKRDRTL